MVKRHFLRQLKQFKHRLNAFYQCPAGERVGFFDDIILDI
jgi:hypothetical protein